MEARNVIMSDGSTIKFGAREKCKKQTLFDANGTATGMAFYFPTGQIVKVMLADLSDEMRSHAACHGIAQKVGDEGAKEDVTTAAEFYQRAIAMQQRLYEGTAWQRQGGGGFGDGDLVQALMELKGKTADEIRAFIKLAAETNGITEKQVRDALKTDSAVKEILDRIAKQRAAAVDTKGLLDML